MSGSSARMSSPSTARYPRALAPTSDTRSCTCESPVIGAPGPGSFTNVTRRILVSRRPPKELQLDLVGISKREHRIVRVRRLFHAGVRDSEFIQAVGPFVECRPTGNDELKVIQTGADLGKRLAGVGRMPDEADHQPA